jgi:hypothetical protein
MLRLSVIVHNPLGDSAITWLGIVPLALVALMVVGLWVVVVSRRARPDEAPDDRGLEALRRFKLIVRRPGGRRGAQAAAAADRKRGPEVRTGEPSAR